MVKIVPEETIEKDVVSLITEQKQLDTLENELMQNETFAKFLTAQKQFKQRSELVWSVIEQEMIKNDIKSIKGEWGSIGITERMGFTIDEELLKTKYLKKVPDLKKIGDDFKLTGIAPAGATPKTTKFLTKRIK